MAKVLVVDDEIEILELVCDEMKRQGHFVVAARSPNVALDLLKLRSNQFDLVICDVVMPQRNGLDFVHEANRIKHFKGEIAMMSSYVTMLDKDIQDAGVKHVIKKPFTLEALIGLTQNLRPAKA